MAIDSGDPCIWVGTDGDDTVNVVVNTMNEGEDGMLAERLADILTTG